MKKTRRASALTHFFVKQNDRKEQLKSIYMALDKNKSGTVDLSSMSALVHSTCNVLKTHSISMKITYFLQKLYEIDNGQGTFKLQVCSRML